MRIEKALTQLGAARDALAAQIQAVLMGAEFGGKPVSGKSGLKLLSKLISEGNALLAQAEALAR